MGTLARYAVSIGVAVPLLAGCGGSQPVSGAPGAVPSSRAVSTDADRGDSRMLSEAKSENLMYISDPATGGVLVYSYTPPRYRFIGFLLGLAQPAGMCVDSRQNVYVTNGSFAGSQAVFEYAHGGTTPIRILGAGGYPVDCAVDPATGNLAVIAFGARQGDFVAIFEKARGKPRIYPDTNFGVRSCTYDLHGNFFMDGAVVSGKLQFAELPRGSSRFRNIALDQTFVSGAGVQWHGNMAVGDAYQDVIYQFHITGRSGTEVGSTPVNGSNTAGDFLIAGHSVIVPSGPQFGGGFVKIYNYPAGGNARRTLSNFTTPVAMVISYATNR
ncbi:MAG TPA: hypothetical protein VIW73_02455 [Candidatus Cybelea sp.]